GSGAAAADGRGVPPADPRGAEAQGTAARAAARSAHHAVGRGDCPQPVSDAARAGRVEAAGGGAGAGSGSIDTAQSRHRRRGGGGTRPARAGDRARSGPRRGALPARRAVPQLAARPRAAGVRSGEAAECDQVRGRGRYDLEGPVRPSSATATATSTATSTTTTT